ncbi:MAG: hypothetical protein IT514_07925, partial [Burkholderiales bacterium]|nr:hypothetical protein [Burkholderiales bacterium]
PQVELAPHPVHGQQVTITLSPHENRAGVEQAIASAFGRFTCAFRVAWREQVESGRIATGG